MKKLLPLGLIAAGLFMLVGCLYLPSFETVHTDKDNPGKDVSGEVGKADSHRPLRVGSATRAQVISRLGQPTRTSPNDRTIYYTWETEQGVWINLCGIFPGTIRVYEIAITFDEHDFLISYKVEKIEERDGPRGGFGG